MKYKIEKWNEKKQAWEFEASTNRIKIAKEVIKMVYEIDKTTIYRIIEVIEIYE